MNISKYHEKGGKMREIKRKGEKEKSESKVKSEKRQLTKCEKRKGVTHTHI